MSRKTEPIETNLDIYFAPSFHEKVNIYPFVCGKINGSFSNIVSVTNPIDNPSLSV